MPRSAGQTFNKAFRAAIAASRCLHHLDRLPPSARPYRYKCRHCRQRFKIATGVLAEPR